jgi:hypothetical protein
MLRKRWLLQAVRVLHLRRRCGFAHGHGSLLEAIRQDIALRLLEHCWAAADTIRS